MTVVTFVADVYPYCKGDVMDLSKDELKVVDTIAKDRDITAYEKGQVEVGASESHDEVLGVAGTKTDTLADAEARTNKK